MASEDRADFESFAAGLATGMGQLVWRTLSGDLETPVSCYLKLAGGRKNLFLLESVEGGASKARYSFIGIAPDLIWKSNGQDAYLATLSHDDLLADKQKFIFKKQDLPTLDSLKALTQQARLDVPAHLPPMAAGLVGYLGYDTIRLVEDIDNQNPDQLDLPEGMFLRPSITIIFDHILDRLTIATPIWPNQDISDHKGAKAQLDKALWDKAMARLDDVASALCQPLAGQHYLASSTPNSSPTSTADNQTTPQDQLWPDNIGRMDPNHYKSMVKKAKDYILAGDIFQVVLSQRFTLPFHGPAFSYYRALRRTNPAPFLFFIEFDDFAIAGSSPEILVRVRDGKMTIRPIAGTRRRGADRQEDLALEQDLLNDPKELAEHLMLLDLGRNDVGRMAELGGVEVSESYQIERYSHVMHIVSNVEGKLADDCHIVDALLAGFPAGTVSGAPKVRAMQIIDELETTRRGVYAGCVGYFAADGSMDSCIALRTAVLKDEKLYIQSGAGIVADSDADAEQKECEAKAAALVQAWHRAQINAT